jgi:hypothetical protein
MSYTALGNIRLFASAAARLIAVSSGSCTVGQQPQPQVTPWGQRQPGPWWDAQGRPQWDTVHFRDHAIMQKCGQDAFCDSNRNCLSPRYWSDPAYRQLKGELSFYRVQEKRVRHLLARLVHPMYGFGSGLEAFAYDASFCRPVTVAPRLLAGVRRALALLDQQYPDDRWRKQKGALKLKCPEQDCTYSRYVDSRNVPRTCAAPILAAKSHCDGALGMTGSGVSVLEAQLWHRYIPIFEAVMVQGNQLVPTPWMRSLLDCLAPRWEMQVKSFALASKHILDLLKK